MNTRDATELRRASIRLALQFGPVIIILFGLLGGITYLIVSSSQAEETTRALIDASAASSPEEVPHDVVMATSTDGVLSVSSGAPSWFPERAQLAAAQKAGDVITVTRTYGGHTYAIRTDAGDGRVTQVAVDTGENTEELQRLMIALVASGAIAAVAAAVVAAVMARRAMRPMVDALSLQRRFVTDASHELRTPLTLLSTRVQLLRHEFPGAMTDPAGSKRIANGLDEVLQDSHELTGILEDLLIAADPRESTVTSPLDIAALAREAIELASADAAERGIEVEGTSRVDPITVEGSRASLFRLYNALISNAVDHAKSRVGVAVTSTGKYAEIRVADDGDGFADGMSDRAFERFATSRADASIATPRHYGIGLALVAEVAARHGGSVMVAPRERGSGAEIIIRLPLSRA